MPEPTWTDVCATDDLHVGRPRLLKSGREQVALFRLEDGRVFAVDNRCPHEGYPMIQGSIKGEVVTCVWHNYKFDLKDGAALLGDEPIRTYEVRQRDGRLEVDLRPPDSAQALPKLWAGLEQGLREYELGRMARETARLLAADVPAYDIIAIAAGWDARHGEWGSTHALPVAADVLALLPRYPGMNALLPLTQLLEIASRPHIRNAERPVPDPVDPGEDPVAAGARLRALVEAEDAAGAEALLRGAVAAGWRRAELEPWFFQLCADHFLDFGHALIYQGKVFDLLDGVGWQHADLLLRAFLCSITLGTREDLLPPWAGTRRRLEILGPDLPGIFALARGPRAGWAHADDEGPARLIAAVLDGTPAEAFQSVHHALRDGVELDRIASALVLAASRRMLRFEPAHETDATITNNWLDVTHLLTFASAARTAISRWHHPDALRLLFHVEHFVHRASALDGPEAEIHPRPHATAADVIRAIRAQDPDAAVRAAAAAWASSPDDLETALVGLSLDDTATRAIVVAHVLKTVVTAAREARATGSVLPVLAAVRFCAAPRRERRVARLVHEALGLVTEGRIPKDLTASGA